MSNQNKEFTFDTVYVIQSLKDDDERTGTLLFDEVIQPYQQTVENFHCQYYEAYNKKEFFEYLEEIKKDVLEKNRFPIIHFEIHGADKYEGMKLRDGHLVTWFEIYSYFIEINSKINNNLLITLAVCNGAGLMQIILPYNRSPFWGIVGNFEEILESELGSGFQGFYRTLLTTRALNRALEVLNDESKKGKQKYKVINSETTFINAYKNYFNEFCSKENLNKRIDWMIHETIPVTYGKEELILKFFSKSFKKKIRNTKKLRKILKKQVLDLNPKFFKKFRDIFFMADLFPDNKGKYLRDYTPDFDSAGK